MTNPPPLEDLSRKACKCDDCFAKPKLGLARPTIAVAQPRWVGSGYWGAKRRILALMLNPGSGENRTDPADRQMYEALLKFRDADALSLSSIFDHQRADMRNGGRGRFWSYFVVGLGLDPNEVAFANIAWCATSGNRYPPEMLSHCFEKFTGPLVELLSPNVILLCGSSVHRFAPKVVEMISSVRVIKTLHYAHREGGLIEHKELRRVRAIIDSIDVSAPR